MNRVSKLLSALVATALLALAFAACGSSDSTTATSTSSTSTTKSPPPIAKESQASQAKPQSKESQKAVHRSEAKEASSFAPKHHNDSGGGSKQFKVKGGDNSIQEFGGEADTSELEEAATVLHNFLDARAEKNWAAACSYMAKSMTQSLETTVAQSHTPCAMTSW